jgi:hypothetical protein
MVVCVSFIFQQITGINVPFYYGRQLLSNFLKGGTSIAVSAAIAGEVTAILGAVNVVATYFGFRWIDKIGPRPLAPEVWAGVADGGIRLPRGAADQVHRPVLARAQRSAARNGHRRIR